MARRLKQLLDEYRQQFKADVSSADQSLLTTARKMLDQSLDRQLKAGYLETDAVHLANEISYFFGGDNQLTIKVLSQYLTQPLAIEEEAWARWQLIDNLAMLRRYEEVVAKQQEFLAWARENLPQDRLLWVMYDSTQAFCWKAATKADEWLQVFEDIMMNTVPSTKNRYDRFIYLRTANRIYNELGMSGEAIQIARQMRDLSEEDPAWAMAIDLRIEAYTSEIVVHWKLQDVSAIRRLGEKATWELEAYARQTQLGDLDFDKKRKLGALYANLAPSLYFARQYDMAIPLLRTAINLGVWEHWTYSWLAASVWAATKSRSEALLLLRQGANRVVGDYHAWKELPEFEDVVADEEFLAAAKRQTNQTKVTAA